MIVHALEELADINIPRDDRTVYGVGLDALMQYSNVNELEAHLNEMISVVPTGYNDHIQTLEDGIASSIASKVAERNTTLAQRRAKHDNYLRNRIAQGSSMGRRDAMYGDYYGLQRLPQYAGYYRARE